MISIIEFIIKKNNRGFIVIRVGGEYNQHSHHKTYQSCLDIINLVRLNKMPKSKYLRGSIKRLLTQQECDNLKECKQMYYNVNKGLKR